MRELLAQPSVAQRWLCTRGLDGTADDLFGNDHVSFVIVADGDVVGHIQYGEEDEPDYRHASIDIFLDERRHGRGLGTDALRTLVRHLVRDRGHHRITIDPAADNAQAIRSYEKVGFRHVGRMREYERGPDGTWHDGLLMDILASEVDQAFALTAGVGPPGQLIAPVVSLPMAASANDALNGRGSGTPVDQARNGPWRPATLS